MPKISPPPQTATQAVAYSYVRFSTPEQAEGDSLRRQTEAAAEWCQRNKVRLDTSRTLHDLGKSAYLGEHRKNPDRYALAAFLKMAEAGDIPKGSFLLVENLDRLTREHLRAAVTLFLSIQEMGISIVTTTPEKVYRHDSSDMVDIILAVVELSRGHSESARKSQLVGDAWGEKKAARREGRPQPTKRNDRVNGMQILTHKLPAWVEVKDGKPVAIPRAAAAVKRIFALSAGGYGHAAMVKKLTEDGVEPIGTAGHWSRSYIALILKDRRAVGEFQPRKVDGSPDGDPILDYFPAVVSEDEWLAARGAAAGRRQKGGAIGKHVNVFAGLLKDAWTGTSYYCATRTERRGTHSRVLVNVEGAEGRASVVSFPFSTFESAVLELLQGVDSREVIGSGDGKPDEASILAGEIAGIDSELAEVAAYMETSGFSPMLGKRVTALEGKRRDLVERHNEARQREANPIGESWAEARTLMGAVNASPDPDGARMRLRGALRRAVDSLWMVIVPRGRSRLCLVQVFFQSGRYQTFLILHTPPKSNGTSRTPGKVVARTFVDVVSGTTPSLKDPQLTDDGKSITAARYAVIMQELDITKI